MWITFLRRRVLRGSEAPTSRETGAVRSRSVGSLSAALSRASRVTLPFGDRSGWKSGDASPISATTRNASQLRLYDRYYGPGFAQARAASPRVLWAIGIVSPESPGRPSRHLKCCDKISSNWRARGGGFPWGTQRLRNGCVAKLAQRGR